jgi:hypothetical protein
MRESWTDVHTLDEGLSLAAIRRSSAAAGCTSQRQRSIGGTVCQSPSPHEKSIFDGESQFPGCINPAGCIDESQ